MACAKRREARASHDARTTCNYLPNNISNINLSVNMNNQRRNTDRCFASSCIIHQPVMHWPSAGLRGPAVVFLRPCSSPQQPASTLHAAWLEMPRLRYLLYLQACWAGQVTNWSKPMALRTRPVFISMIHHQPSCSRFLLPIACWKMSLKYQCYYASSRHADLGIFVTGQTRDKNKIFEYAAFMLWMLSVLARSRQQPV